jgi:Protein of unknown function (DUF1501)
MSFENDMWDEYSRRAFMAHAAKTCLGVVACGGLFGRSQSMAADSPAKLPIRATGKATNVIYLRMRGAMSHLDTFDPKPGRPEQGETKVIDTKTPGIQIAEYFPGLAKLTNHMAIVRSATTTTGDHGGATYLLQTSYRQLATIRHPAIGAFANKLLGLRKKTLPDYISIGLGERNAGAGYLEPAFTPVPVGDPKLGLKNTEPPKYLQGGQFEERMDLINKFSADFRSKYPQKQVKAYEEYYKQAITLLGSKDLEAFDLNKEKDSVRDKYGRDSFGQGVLLARRLIEQDVRWVDASLGGWDMHNDIFGDKAMKSVGANLDRAMSALLEDLAASGLIKKTLVVLATEFGRKPMISERGGRDHHPAAFSLVLAGAGVKGGLVYGKSDERGQNVDDDSIHVSDFNATIAAAMGLPWKEEIHSKSGRPFRIANEGEPITKILA